MYVVHDVPGRLRVKLEKLKNNPHRLDQVEDMLRIDGTYRVKSNATTGSVVIEYDKLSVQPKTFTDLLNRNGYVLDPQKKLERTAETHEKIAASLGKATFSWLAGRVLEANGMPYIAAFI